MAERWNSETTIKFIQEFRSYECLWNTKSPTYKNKQMRQTSLQKIVEAMNIQGFGIPEAKNKMRNLRSTYYQEKRKIEKSKTSGSGSDDVYVPNLKWYTEMNALLKDVDGSRKTFDNIDEDTQSTQDATIGTQNDNPETQDDTPGTQDDTPGTQDENSQFPQETDTTFTDNGEHTRKRVNVASKQGKGSDHPPEKKVSNRKGIFRAIGELKKLQELINKDQPVPNLSFQDQEENQFDVFGKSVAAQLKTLSYDKALTAQSRIQQILSDLAIENYRYTSALGCTTATTSGMSSPIDSAISTPRRENQDSLSAAIAFGLESPIYPDDT